MKYGHALRRFTEHTPALTVIKTLAADHPAIVEGRTMYRARVTLPGDSPRLLKSGAHNRKIGGRVVKGPWQGLPIYTLTLEERATCGLCWGTERNIAFLAH